MENEAGSGKKGTFTSKVYTLSYCLVNIIYFTEIPPKKNSN